MADLRPLTFGAGGAGVPACRCLTGTEACPTKPNLEKVRLMRLPLSYALRNLTRRPWRSAMTVAGIAVVIFAASLIMGLSRGLFARLDVTGEAENLLVIVFKRVADIHQQDNATERLAGFQVAGDVALPLAFHGF